MLTKNDLLSKRNLPFYPCLNAHTQNSYLLLWENYLPSCLIISASVKQFTLLLHEFNFHPKTCGYLTLDYVFTYLLCHLFECNLIEETLFCLDYSGDLDPQCP